MDSITKHKQPYPLVTDQAVGDQPPCKANAIDTEASWVWRCTRLADHEGAHEAGTLTGHVMASWPQR